MSSDVVPNRYECDDMRYTAAAHPPLTCDASSIPRVAVCNPSGTIVLAQTRVCASSITRHLSEWLIKCFESVTYAIVVSYVVFKVSECMNTFDVSSGLSRVFDRTRDSSSKNELTSRPTSRSTCSTLPSGVERSHVRTARSMVLRLGVERRRTKGGLDEVGGLESVKTELRRCVLLPMRHTHIFYDTSTPLGIRPPRGILLHGPPGTGKTMLVRALATDSGVPLMSMHSAVLESKWFGESPKLLSAAFHVARTELAPCIVFFDEIDGFGRARSELDQSCVYSFKCELLRHMDGIDGVASNARSAIVVIACTNCVRSLDPALRRRFTKTIEIPRPSETERLDILCKLTWSGRRRRDDSHHDEDNDDDDDNNNNNNNRVSLSKDEVRRLRRVARETEHMTGADLAAIFADASARRMDDYYYYHTSATIGNTNDKSRHVDAVADSSVAIADSRLSTMRSGAELVAELGPIKWCHWKRALHSHIQSCGCRGGASRTYDMFQK